MHNFCVGKHKLIGFSSASEIWHGCKKICPHGLSSPFLALEPLGEAAKRQQLQAFKSIVVNRQGLSQEADSMPLNQTGPPKKQEARDP